MYKLFKLNNGLKVIIENIDYVNSVAVGLWIGSGSRNEDPINNGISHFIEHMFFKGTKSRSAKDIVETVENVGGQINAFTGKESTCFYVKTLDTHLELSLDLLSDMLFNSKFTLEDIEKEKKVVLEEIKMNNDSPEDTLMNLHSIAAFGKDAIALPILGDEKTVQSFTREMLVKYMNSHYIPNNSVISVCGNFDIKTIEKTIENFFGSWHGSSIETTNYSMPIIMNNNLFENKKIEQLHMSLGIRGVELGNDNIYPLMLLNTIIGGGASSILFQKIREELGMCYSIYSYISSYKNCGMVSIYTSLNPEYAVDAVHYIKEELYKFSSKKVSGEKLVSLKEQLKGNFILGLESTSSRMFRNGRMALFFNKIITPNEIMRKIDSIDREQLWDVMKDTYADGIQNSAFVGENYDRSLICRVMEREQVAFKNPQKLNL